MADITKSQFTKSIIMQETPLKTIEEEEEEMDFEDIMAKNMADGPLAESDHESDSISIQDDLDELNGLNEKSINESKKEVKDIDFTKKKTPFAMLAGLFKEALIEYKESTVVKENITYYKCEVFLAGEAKGKGIYYNKKSAKYQAVINTLKEYGIEYDFLNLLESETIDDDDFDNNSSQVPKKSVRFNEEVETVNYNEENKCKVRIEPLNIAYDDDDDDEEAMSFSDLGMIDDSNQHNQMNNKNRKPNLAFLWYDFHRKKVKNRNCNAVRPLGSNMLDNPIGFINERCARNSIPLPTYTIMLAYDGNQKLYQATISLCDLRFAAIAYSKKDAKFAAAKKLIMYGVKLHKKNNWQKNNSQNMYRRKFPNNRR